MCHIVTGVLSLAVDVGNQMGLGGHYGGEQVLVTGRRSEERKVRVGFNHTSRTRGEGRVRPRRGCYAGCGG